MSGERTEKATPKRMKELRRKGSLGRSHELSTWAGVGAAALALPMVVRRGRAAATEQLARVPAAAASGDASSAVAALAAGLRSVLTTLTPLLVAAVAVTLLIGVAQGGYRPRRPKLHVDQLAPTKAAKKLFGPQVWWQGTQTVLKTAAVALVLVTVVRGAIPMLLVSGRLPLGTLVGEAAHDATTVLRAGVVAGLALAVLDAVVVMRRNRKQTRMSRQDIKDENRTTEGDPHVKGAIRSRQMAMSRNRMMAAVGEADVVLVNPTHVAVALRYEPGRGAPRVVAKGAGAVAARIREEAGRARVPLVEDVPLARALHAACELGEEIPEYLFTAVARVLAFVMALRRRGASTGHHRVPGGTSLPADAPADHRTAGRAARRAARGPGRRAVPAASRPAAPAPRPAAPVPASQETR
jgi:flagellar biosynthetic protein FlhB